MGNGRSEPGPKTSESSTVKSTGQVDDPNATAGGDASRRRN